MRRLGLLLLTLFPLACAPAPSAPVTAQEAPSAMPSTSPPSAEVVPSLVPPVSDAPANSPSPSPSTSPSPYPQTVTGRWAAGTTNEPIAGAVESCGDEVRLLEDVDGLSLVSEGGGDMAAGRREGARLLLAPVSRAEATRVGRVPAAFDLTFDPVSGHYHGTRNGAPYWLAPVSKSCRVEPLEQATIRGEVRDVDGRLVTSGTIHIVSEEPSYPFETTVGLVNGKYVINQVKSSVKFEFTLTADGYLPLTCRRRIPAWPTVTTPLFLNFGGPATAEDPDAPAYPLVPKPSPAVGT